MLAVIVIMMRTALGCAVSGGLGFLGFLLAWMAFDAFVKSVSSGPSPRTVFITAWFTSAGLAAGLGAFLAWLGTESRRRFFIGILIVLLLAGVGGCYAGYYYSVYVNKGSFYARYRPHSGAALFGAALAPNAIATFLAIVQQVRSSRRVGEWDPRFYGFLGHRRW